MFEIGQLVVCVNGDWSDSWTSADTLAILKDQGDPNPVLPEQSQIYEVRDVGPYIAREYGLRLVEIVNKLIRTNVGKMVEPLFESGHFRLIQKREADLFRELTAPRQVERATAKMIDEVAQMCAEAVLRKPLQPPYNCRCWPKP